MSDKLPEAKVKPNYHPEIAQALANKDYEKICQHLHTNHFESDSEWTVKRCNDSYIGGFKDAELYYSNLERKAQKLVEALEYLRDNRIHDSRVTTHCEQALAEYKSEG